MQLISGVNTSGLYAFSAASAGLATNDENGNNITQTYVPNASLEYNAVDEISGIAGSAISQYGAEKQWLVHDETLCHLSNSAQYALGVAIDNVARLMGVDQTLLFSASTPTSAAELSESIYNFNSLKVYIDMNTTDRPKPVIEIQPHSNMTIGWAQGVEAAYYTVVRLKPTDDTHLVIDRGKSISMGLFTATTASPVTAATGAAYQNVISRIYGIGRKDNT